MKNSEKEKLIDIDVITPVLTSYSHCPHCEMIFDQLDIASKSHNIDINEYPQDLKAEYLKVCEFIKSLNKKFRERIKVKIIDPQSLTGMYKSIRFGVRKYPTFLINRRFKVTGFNEEDILNLIENFLTYEKFKGGD